jgi:hypothetical protein
MNRDYCDRQSVRRGKNHSRSFALYRVQCYLFKVSACNWSGDELVRRCPRVIAAVLILLEYWPSSALMMSFAFVVFVVGRQQCWRVRHSISRRPSTSPRRHVGRKSFPAALLVQLVQVGTAQQPGVVYNRSLCVDLSQGRVFEEGLFAS